MGSRVGETISFFVDVVTEDSFYENLTLGVVKILENSPCVKNVRVDRRNGCERNAIANWEQRHGCVLPEDVKNFYASIDGFLLQWNLEIAAEEFPVGRMEIGRLSSLKRYLGIRKERQSRTTSLFTEEEDFELEEDEMVMESTTEDNVAGSSSEIQITANLRGTKLFEIARCFPPSSDAKIYLAYPSKVEQTAPEIWLHRESTDRWYPLAESFTRYFRMMLVHLGLPLWQCCVLELPLPTWVEQVYFLVGPHLLPSTVELGETISSSLWNNGPPNLLDPGIFKSKENKQRLQKKK
ncbi:hypothetical protein KPH14_011382 [Odynerus spinipes]|uniref:Knr4/Smi1-like domain-containing protein n=1 Tax=Odynerus spinipes TaxID=1348599 RepID=A0AAD9VN50_9HYME|nr:hypothetical protein KPH14_011382 [Odynerus spinipes]